MTEATDTAAMSSIKKLRVIMLERVVFFYLPGCFTAFDFFGSDGNDTSKGKGENERGAPREQW